MKKLLYTFAMLLAVVSAGAQVIETLNVSRKEADPLFNEKVGRKVFSTNSVVIELYDNNSVKWWLKNPPHIFVGDKNILNGERKATCNTKFGVFNSDSTIIISTDSWKGVPSEHGTILNMYGREKIKSTQGKKRDFTIIDILAGLTMYPGSYVRMAIPVYGDYYWTIGFKLPDEMYRKIK